MGGGGGTGLSWGNDTPGSSGIGVARMVGLEGLVWKVHHRDCRILLARVKHLWVFPPILHTVVLSLVYSSSLGWFHISHCSSPSLLITQEGHPLHPHLHHLITAPAPSPLKSFSILF